MLRKRSRPCSKTQIIQDNFEDFGIAIDENASVDFRQRQNQGQLTRLARSKDLTDKENMLQSREWREKVHEQSKNESFGFSQDEQSEAENKREQELNEHLLKIVQAPTVHAEEGMAWEL